jgi:hypothetical protein
VATPTVGVGEPVMVDGIEFAFEGIDCVFVVCTILYTSTPERSTSTTMQGIRTNGNFFIYYFMIASGTFSPLTIANALIAL